MINIERIEKHIINKNHPMYEACDLLCFQSKNMYNLCNYTIRQAFIKDGVVKKYGDLNKELKYTDAFKELGSNSAQMVTKILCKNWKSFLVAVADYTKHPDKYFAKPKIPKYLKKDGRFVCTLTNWQTQIHDGYLYFAFKRLKPFNNMFRTKVTGYHLSTRIVPKGGCYVLEIVYRKEPIQLNLDRNRIVSIDLGVNNFVTMVNNIGKQPIVINGKGIKSYNQYWNKEISKYRSIAKKINNLDWTKHLQRITNKRNFKLTWNDLSSKHFEELMKNYYELADGSSGLLNKRKKYDLNTNGPIAKVLVKEDPKIADDNKISLAIKNIANYNEVYQKIKKLNEWIREYNKMGFKLNVPSVEFKIPLKEVYNDYRINDENNGTNQRN